MRTKCTQCVHCPKTLWYGPACSQGFKVIEDLLEMGPISKSNPDLCPGFEQKKSREVNRFTKVLGGMVV